VPFVNGVLRDTYLEIEKRREIYFLEGGTDRDRSHFLIQSFPIYSVTQIVTRVENLTACEVFAKVREVKKGFGEANFWEKDFVNTVG